ncbi:MAG: hypothetical protein JXA11_10790, partial [Phycisphaerae bacterium]|nr:hypothetical protein [Phycisphaerae bacterium]
KKLQGSRIKILCDFQVFRLKGVDIPAQGEALGVCYPKKQNPERAKHMSRPFRAWMIKKPFSQGFALGWYISARWAGRKDNDA